MNAIELADAVAAFRQLHADFERCYEIALHECGEETVCALVWGSFADNLTARFRNGAAPDLTTVSAYVERLMTEGTQETQDVVATIFLEAILNHADEHPQPMRDLLAALGPESKAYCLAWNKFTGNTNEGI